MQSEQRPILNQPNENYEMQDVVTIFATVLNGFCKAFPQAQAPAALDSGSQPEGGSDLDLNLSPMLLNCGSGQGPIQRFFSASETRVPGPCPN